MRYLAVAWTRVADLGPGCGAGAFHPSKDQSNTIDGAQNERAASTLSNCVAAGTRSIIIHGWLPGRRDGLPREARSSAGHATMAWGGIVDGSSTIGETT